jgi:TDG/mug DNA glycosylase family protein
VPRPRDVLANKPRILFVGINPGATSGKVGHHFAGAGNPFWQLLHAAGLTPIELTAEEDGRLPEFDCALVNLCARPTKTAAELKRKELHRGRELLLEKIDKMQPAVVALVGITLYPLVLELKGKLAKPGPGAKPETIGSSRARVFVVPNPSGLNASFPTFADKLPWFKKLAAYASRA